MKIVLIRFSSLGDVVLSTVAVENILSNDARAQILLFTKKRYSDLFDADPRVKILPLEEGRGSARELGELHRTVRVLREMKPDLLIDLQRNPRSVLLRGLAGSRKVVAYPKGHAERSSFVRKKDFQEPYTHTVDRYNMALREAGLASPNRIPKLLVTPKEEKLAEQLLKRIGVEVARPVVGVHFGAKHPAKRWGDEKFAELVEMLADRPDLNVVVIPSEEDLSGEELFSSGKGNVFWTGRLSLKELKALVPCCEVLVCNDSGVMHLAVALGVPVVAIFGPTHACLGFYPLGEHDILLSSYEYCSPCSLHGERQCFRDKRYCMEKVSVSQVSEATVSLLSKKSENVRQAR